MLVISSGKSYLDIDGYASGIAYAYLLQQLNKNAVFCSMATPNASVSAMILALGFKIDRYIPNDNDEFIVVDLSNPQFIDTSVKQSNIIEIIDHHSGFEDYWKNQKTIQVQIENIGAVATIIFEKFIAYKKEHLLTKNMCKLLMAAILDNTLNLKSSNTTERDIEAFYKLKTIGNVSDSFNQEYFLSCESEIQKNPIEFIIKDIKEEKISNILPKNFAQVTIYHLNVIINNINEISKYFNQQYNEWILNIICLEDGKSYIYANNNSLKTLSKFFDESIVDNSHIVLNHFMLRKEIIKKGRAL